MNKIIDTLEKYGYTIEDINNIATSDKITLSYSDNKDYMRNNLIPVIESDVVKFAMKNSLNNYTNNDICKYNDEYNACSLYEFTITNNAKVTQEFNVSIESIVELNDGTLIMICDDKWELTLVQ